MRFSRKSHAGPWTGWHCSRLVQRLAWLGLGLLLALPAASASCPGPVLRFEPLGPGLWWVPAGGGDADAANRGQVSNLLLARDGQRMWLMGSGPSPGFGRALACQVKAQLGRALTDVVSPWPRPELVLGIAGLGAVRSWAHEDVAQAMRKSCPGCVERLRQRLGEAGADLGPDPIRVPTLRLRGDQGRLGPWHWWRLSRGAGYPVTVWQHRRLPLRWAPGLLWGSDVADARDADIETLVRSLQALRELPPVALWLGEQGTPMPGGRAQDASDPPTRHLAYWRALADAVHQAQERGDIDTGQAPLLPGLDAASRDPRHGLNWQRAWRQAEAWGQEHERAAGADQPPATGRWLQRSLR